MNKFQIAGLWIAATALAVWMCMKQETPYYTASAGVIALAAIITYNATRKQHHEHYSMPDVSPGKKTPATGAVSSSFPSVMMPGPFSKGAVVFKREAMEYNGKTYYYKNFTGMLYNTVKLVVHGIPSSQSYIVGFRSTDGGVTLSFSSALFINNDKMNEIYVKLANLACQYIQPQITAGIVRDIFKTGKTVKIGPLEFSSKGYSRKILFGGVELIAWNSKVYIAQLHEGHAYVYRDKNGKSQVMKTLSMQTMNAVILPSLVQACYDEANGIQRT